MFAVSTVFGMAVASLALVPVFLALLTDVISGLGIAFIGVGMAIFLAGIGSSVGVGMAGEAASGVVSE